MVCSAAQKSAPADLAAVVKIDEIWFHDIQLLEGVRVLRILNITDEFENVLRIHLFPFQPSLLAAILSLEYCWVWVNQVRH